MMGSPFYYDVLFDEGPGDVVFHDCMWSGICTCCIQLLHQDSFYHQYTNESPDLKVDDSNCRTQAALDPLDPRLRLTVPLANSIINNSNTQTSPLDTNNNTNINNNIINSIKQAPSSRTLSTSISPDLNSSTTNTSIHNTNNVHINNNSNCSTSSSSSCSNNNHHYHHHHINNQQHCSSSDMNFRRNSSPNSTLPDTNPSSSSTSPDHHHHLHHHHHKTSSSSSSTSSSNSTSPKPIRRREHNDSERKRRDHLRNAFNFLRDQVPRFKAINKKPPRIQILHEATKYVQSIMRESDELQRRLDDERAKHERLQKL